MIAEYLSSIFIVTLCWSALTMGYAMVAPEHLQPHKMDRLAGLLENLFVTSLFALLAMYASH